MRFTDVCVITEDVPGMTRFYESVFRVKAVGDDIHSAIQTDGAGIALYSKKAAECDMMFDFSQFWGTGSVTIGYNVEDVDREFERLKSLNVNFMTTPTTWPWGARSFHFRDPDGNIICFRTVSA